MKRNMNNKMILGVCSGIAKEMDIDPTVVRAVFAIATLMGFGLPIVVYIVMALVMPTE